MYYMYRLGSDSAQLPKVVMMTTFGNSFCDRMMHRQLQHEDELEKRREHELEKRAAAAEAAAAEEEERQGQQQQQQQSKGKGKNKGGKGKSKDIEREPVGPWSRQREGAAQALREGRLDVMQQQRARASARTSART